jgi:predicted dehydrogenase
MIDLALWILNFPNIIECSSKLFSQGRRFESAVKKVEDYAAAQLTANTGTIINLCCSWNLSAGCDAIIKAEFFGNNGAAVWENINGSFYNFKSNKMKGTSLQPLYEEPDDWFGKAAADWSLKLIKDKSFNPHVGSVTQVAKVIDMIYQR